MNIQVLLKNFGLSEKETAVYLALIDLGPSPVRAIAAKSKVNRGTSYDILKDLIKLGIASYYNKESKQYFVAEEPEKLLSAIDQKKEDLDEIRTNIKENLPLLKTLFEKQGGKPVIKLYEGNKGIRFILEDVLTTLKNSSDRLYYVYSSSDVKNELYKAYKDFNKDRLKYKICNKVIAFGKGGELVGLDERKWMNAEHGTPTYIIIYSGKVVMISISSSGEPIGVIMEDSGLYQTQKMIFEFNWRQL
jgi:HTH-type transcriptional regulator, sugar sensing transcriptional regulator